MAGPLHEKNGVTRPLRHSAFLNPLRLVYFLFLPFRMRFLVFETVDGSGNAAATVDKVAAIKPVHRHDRRVSQ